LSISKLQNQLFLTLLLRFSLVFTKIVKMKKIINTEAAPKAIGPYSQAAVANGMLFISGQIPLDPATGKMIDGGISEQTEQVMKNIGAILKEAGFEFKDVVKSTCLLSDMDNFAPMNVVYGKYYSENPPARATYAVVKLPLGALIEIETIAVR
jgi:2-iminobutanoate/2-iminopropanoate deaminase